MSSGAERPPAAAVKLALCGDSGVGKSIASTVPLILAGYKVYTIDIDNKINVVLNALHETNSPFYALAQKIDLDKAFRYETVSHKMITMEDVNRIRIQPAAATVWPKIQKLVHEWKEECGYRAGLISSWGPDTILVLDSATFAGFASLYYNQQLNQHLGAILSGREWQRDIGGAQSDITTMLQHLCSSSVKCNVIVIFHIDYMTMTESTQNNREGQRVRTVSVSANATDIYGSARAYPTTIGAKLSPKVGNFFNNVFEMKLVGNRRLIYTTPQNAINVKSESFNLKPSYESSTGLPEIFATLRNQPQPIELLEALQRPRQTPNLTPPITKAS